MKKKWFFLAGIVLIVAGLGWLDSAINKSTKQTQRQANQNTPTANSTLHPLKWDDLPDMQKLEALKGLQLLFDHWAAASEKTGPAPKYLQDAIDTRDKGKILRAFEYVYFSKMWKMKDVIPAFKSFLNDKDPFVRYLAAQDLFIVGDDSGYQALLDLVQADDYIPGLDGAGDLRIHAARILAQYDQVNATQAIYNLYQQTNRGELIRILTTLQSNEATAIVQEKGFFNDSGALAYYGQANVQQFIPQITSTFNSAQQPGLKVAAAWALATMTNDQNAISYLVQQGQYVVQNPQILNGTQNGADQYTAGVDAIKYLGTIQTPAAKQTLEAALGSSDPTIVQTAIVNLVYNQGGSDQAVQVIANQLNNPTHATLPWDFTLNMATQLLDNPQIQSAGQSFSQKDGTGIWQLYTVERKNWSVNNWIGGYVVKLNKK